MHRGSCLCRAVRFEVTGPLPPPDACHCKQCRKHSGHFFVSTTCGSTLFWDRIGADWTAIAMGAFESPTDTKTKIHIYVAEKGDYYEIADGLPQAETVPGK